MGLDSSKMDLNIYFKALIAAIIKIFYWTIYCFECGEQLIVCMVSWKSHSKNDWNSGHI